MQRIHNVKKWSHVQAGGAMNFANEAERRIRLDVNAAGRASLYYVDGDGETTLLGVVEGRDVIEFATHGGAFSIVCEDADVWVYTIDGEDLSFANPDAVKFTKIIERRARNPEMELMQYMMRRNWEIMRESQKHEFDRMWAERERVAAAAPSQPAPASDVAGIAAEPQPDERAGSGDVDPPADGGNAGAFGKKGK